MNIEKEYSRRWLPLVMSAAVVLLLLVMVMGSTWAHFEAEIIERTTMRYVYTADEVYILSAEKDAEGAYVTDENGYLKEPEGWVSVTAENTSPESAEEGAVEEGETAEESSGIYALRFLLANGRRVGSSADQTQTIALTVFATQGIADPVLLNITLSDGGSTYTAKPMEVKAGSAWHDAYGPGWTYRFYNAAGEELSWTLQGGVPTFREMTLTVSGAGQADALLTLLATVQPNLD